MVEQLQDKEDSLDQEEFLDAFQDETASIMAKNLNQAFRAQDDLIWNDTKGTNKEETKDKKDESRKEVTLQPPLPQEASPANEKPNICQTCSGHNIQKPGRYHQILTAVTANLIGALLIPRLPMTMALFSNQPIIHPVKDMKGTTGVIECSILDEPELKPGQGMSQAHLDYIQMCNSIYDGVNNDDSDQLSTPVLLLDHCIVKKANGVCVPLAKVNWLCKDTPTWI